MAKRSAVEMLPAEVKTWLDKALAKGNFSGYTLLESELKTRGFDIGKSSIHRYGQKLERRLAALKDSTAAAQAVVEAAPDDGDARSEAILALVQTEMFDAIMALQQAEEEDDPSQRLKILASIGKSIAATSRASVNQKKWSVAIREKLKAAADQSEEIAKSSGMSDEDWAKIRANFLGIKVD
jgi:hypothetical protein